VSERPGPLQDGARGVLNRWGFRKTLVGSSNRGAGMFGVSIAAASYTLVHLFPWQS
jgi:hypothetical protein